MPWPPDEFSPVLADLLRAERRLVLAPRGPEESRRPQLERLTTDSIFPAPCVRNPVAARACLAGLWLYFDFLDESHAISQELHTPEGSYWHAVMHRREQDFGNSKYWFQRVGQHAIFPALARQAATLTQADTAYPTAARLLMTPDAWDPYAFVDLCAAAVQGQGPMTAVCECIQHAEWRFLFAHCYQQAMTAVNR